MATTTVLLAHFILPRVPHMQAQIYICRALKTPKLWGPLFKNIYSHCKANPCIAFITSLLVHRIDLHHN